MTKTHTGRRLCRLILIAAGLSACAETTIERPSETALQQPPETTLQRSQQTTADSGQPVAAQQTLDAIAAHLQVSYQVIDNRPGDHCDPARGTACFISEISLSSAIDLDAGGWAIYFSQISPLQRVVAGAFSVEHINGDLHKLKPAPALKKIAAGRPYKIRMISDNWHLSTSDLMPNYYVAAPGREARVIASTRTAIDADTGLETRPYAGVFNHKARHLLRPGGDTTRPATAAALFDSNRDTAFVADGLERAIVPTPASVRRPAGGGQLDLSAGLALRLSGLQRPAIEAALAALADLGIAETAGGIPVQIAIAAQPDRSAGAYRLQLNSGHIAIRAADPEGAAHALRSLASLLMPGSRRVPLLAIEDSPRYPFRGLHVDVARNFHSRQLLLRLLEQMAVFKLNRLHLHLGDDEGWRLQIDGLDELTRIGSRRCHDPGEDRCLLPQLGSGPDAGSDVNGFYAAEDYIEILRHAGARHIQVIPSFDMPGHSRAAVKAMEARYRNYLAQGDSAAAEQYLLTDPADTTRYQSIQFYRDNTINVCMDSAYAFVEKVIDEVARLHRRAGQPLRRYHIGADETAGAWAESPACKAFVAKGGGPGDIAALSGYFIERVAAMLAAKGIEAAGWSDGMGHTDPGRMPATVQSNAWGALFWQGHKSAHEQVNRGWQVIVSTPDVTYFDAPYEVDPYERGYYWSSRGTNTRKVFNFMPDNLPAHAELWRGRIGEALTLRDAVQRDDGGAVSHRPMAAGKRFAGLQGQLWSETVRADAQVEYMLFPRLVALAERAWHSADWELPYDYNGRDYSAGSGFFSADKRRRRDAAWARFASVLSAKVLPKLDMAGIRYRIPTPGGAVIAGRLHSNVIFPGLEVEYRIGGGPWTLWSAPVAIDNTAATIELRVRSADGKRRGRALALN